jgi:hypothetical protein
LNLNFQIIHTPHKKLQLYNKIIANYNPKSIEIGSIVSNKLMPIFNDSLDLHKHIEKNHNDLDKKKTYDLFLLVPNKRQLQKILYEPSINHFSFLTSISNSFHLKNTKMTLLEGDLDIENMIASLDLNTDRYIDAHIKLYVSCINYCPLEGIIDNNTIVDRLLILNKLKVDILCLSDTCGMLNCNDFVYIVDMCNKLGLPYSKLSLHLHVKNGREEEIEKIIHKALDRKIIHFDVSLLDTGGCSITLSQEQLVPNLSYELYYKSLVNYIKKNT